MKEKVLSGKNNGFFMLVLFIFLYIASIMLIPFGGASGNFFFSAIGFIWVFIGWFPFKGLIILKPQEAIVLTLFGKYKGTLKEEGFYWVNPFCSAINPASRTHLRQSDDIGKTVMQDTQPITANKKIY
mgnify:FL=1